MRHFLQSYLSHSRLDHDDWEGLRIWEALLSARPDDSNSCSFHDHSALVKYCGMVSSGSSILWHAHLGHYCEFI